MANPVYLTLNGELRGLISSGCSSMPSIGNKAQIAHQDQIMVMSLSHGLSRAQNVNHRGTDYHETGGQILPFWARPFRRMNV